MCLAVPMKIIEINGEENSFAAPASALVEMNSIRKEVRLDIIDRWPEVGEYVIVHAGFAIHALSEEDALENLKLFKEMAAGAGMELF